MLSLMIKGMVLGFSIAAPVGPIGLLCIHRSLQEGHKSGLMTGAGAAIADGTYGGIAAFGLTAVSSFLMDYQFWIRLMGGIFLLYLGIVVARSKPATQAPKDKAKISLIRTFITTFFLTLTNPMTIVSYIGVFAGLGVGSMHTRHSDATLLVFGVVIGSMLWWIILSSVIAVTFKDRLNFSLLQWINYLSAFILIVFGLIAVLSVF